MFNQSDQQKGDHIDMYIEELMAEAMEEKIIEAVRGFPCLWQPKSPSYKDLRAKENAWKEVANQVSRNIVYMHIYI